MQKILLYIELIILVIATIFVSVRTETEEIIPAINENKEAVMAFQDDVAVEYAFVDEGGCGRIRVKNNSENQLISYNLLVYYFDENKQLIDEKTVEIKDIMLPSGFVGGMDKHIPMPETEKGSCKYLWSRVKSAEFTTAEPFINEPIEYTEGTPLITMQDIVSNTAVADSANNCSFLEITNVSPAKEDINSERKNLIFYAKNVGNKTIKNINFIIAQFDENNKPVNVAPNIYIGENIRQLYWNDVNLVPDKGKKAVSQLVLEPECVRVRLIVESVEFDNGIVWLNQGSFEWILNNRMEVKK